MATVNEGVIRQWSILIAFHDGLNTILGDRLPSKVNAFLGRILGIILRLNMKFATYTVISRRADT